MGRDKSSFYHESKSRNMLEVGRQTEDSSANVHNFNWLVKNLGGIKQNFPIFPMSAFGIRVSIKNILI